ncbi:MAG: hypothetical protein IK047_01260, partial [Clostridia bacterium]|nr:hypothetical protein [Clostridia bacterium]
KAVPGQTSIVFGDEAQGIAPPETGFVFHPITVEGRVIGAVGVIGPKRMDYKKVIASLDYFAEGLTGQMGRALGSKNELMIEGGGKDERGKEE